MVLFLSKRQRHLPHLDFQDPPTCGRSAIKLVLNLQIALSKNCVYLALIRFPVLQFGFEPGKFNSEHTFLHLLTQPANDPPSSTQLWNQLLVDTTSTSLPLYGLFQTKRDKSRQFQTNYDKSGRCLQTIQAPNQKSNLKKAFQNARRIIFANPSHNIAIKRYKT